MKRRYITPDHDKRAPRAKGQIWTADEFIPGDPNQSIVIFSAITINTHFNMQAVQKKDPYSHSYYVDTMLIDSKGSRIVTAVIDFEKQ